MVKNITLSAEENLISRARKKAQEGNTTLNALFRDWLTKFVQRSNAVENFDSLMDSLNSVSTDKKYSRDEMNER